VKLRFGSRQSVHVAIGFFLLMAAAYSQPVPSSGKVLAEDVFKNVQVLKGTSVGEFMDIMGFFSASLGLNCVHCHVNESLTHWERFADDVPRKRIARQMVLMVDAINKTNFGGRRVVTCYSCHHGSIQPEGVPSLMVQYGLPLEDPDATEIVPDAPKGPSAEQTLDKFISAIGGTDRLGGLKSLMEQGTYEGYDSYQQKVPFEVFAKAPDQRTTIAHTQNGETTTTFDGRAGWIAAVDKPLRLMTLSSGDLDGAKLDADLAFPGNIKQGLRQWRVGFPMTTIEDKQVQIVQGTGSAGTRIKLFFEVDSGLLTRVVRYNNTRLGIVPTQIDYSDYRDVVGVKVPFRWVITWTSGQSTIELSDVRANVPIDDAKFAQPAPAAVKKAVQPANEPTIR
jgi:outer membrane lipoprotein-sorting protein